MRRFALPPSATVVFITALAAALVAMRLRSYGDIPEWDISTYSLIAGALRRGQRLYADIWDIKPPAIFVTFAIAQRLCGNGIGGVVAMSISAAVATLIAVWRCHCGLRIADCGFSRGIDCRSRIARRAPERREQLESRISDFGFPPSGRFLIAQPATWSAVFFVVLCFEPSSAANLPNTEVFINLFLTIAWALLLNAPARRRMWTAIVLAGTCAAVATSYKQVAAIQLIGLAASHAIAAPRERRRSAIAQAAVFVAPMLVLWAGLFAYFYLTHRGGLFWNTIVVYPRYYSGGMGHNLIAVFSPGAWARAPLPATAPLLGLIVMAAVAFWVARGPRSGNDCANTGFRAVRARDEVAQPLPRSARIQRETESNGREADCDAGEGNHGAGDVSQSENEAPRLSRELPPTSFVRAAISAPACDRSMIFLAFMFVATFIAIALPGQFAGHYFQLLFPPLAIGAGRAAAALIGAFPRQRGLMIALAALSAVAAFAPQAPWYLGDGESFSRRRYGQFFMTARDDMRDFAKRLRPGENVYVWADEPWLYGVANQRCDYAGIWQMHCVAGPLADALTARTLAQLADHPPTYVIFWMQPQPADHVVTRWLMTHYRPVPRTASFPLVFYKRSDRSD